MNADAERPEFSASQKIYALLLRAYPRRHREEYGAAMMQLFRDQCRDAWTEDRGWGMTKLWLRLVPDLINSSVWERLAALKERKNMNDNLAELSTNRNSRGGVFLSVFAVVVILGTSWGVFCAMVLPPTYAGTCKIKFENKHVDTLTPNPKPNVFNPGSFYIQPEYQVITSPLILSNVIAKLGLNVMWGKKYFNGQTLKTAESLQILQSRVTVTPIPYARLTSITAYSDDKAEAAEIANAVVEAYKNYRVKYRDEFEAGVLAELQKEYLQQSNQIAALRAEADLPPQKQPSAESGSAKRKQLDELLRSHEQLSAAIKRAEFYVGLPNTQLVQVTDLAKPNSIPVRPNKTFEIVIGAIEGIIFGSVAGAVAMWVSTRRANRRAVA